MAKRDPFAQWPDGCSQCLRGQPLIWSAVCTILECDWERMQCPVTRSANVDLSLVGGSVAGWAALPDWAFEMPFFPFRQIVQISQIGLQVLSHRTFIRGRFVGGRGRTGKKCRPCCSILLLFGSALKGHTSGDLDGSLLERLTVN